MKRNTYNPEDSEAARQFKIILDDILFESRLKKNKAAAKLNISSERMYKYVNSKAIDNNLPAYMLPLWHKMIGPELLRWVNNEAGCTTVELPEKASNVMDAVTAASRAMKECSEAIDVFAKAVQDGSVSAWEMKDIKREITEALSALVGLQVTAENMRRR
ncbi:Transcriptional regulator [Candidatus Magnetomoraceae bacterium gMMP-15]